MISILDIFSDDYDPLENNTSWCLKFSECYQQRERMMKKTCRKSSPEVTSQLNMTSLYTHLRVSEEQRIIFCDSPLIGAVRMKRIYSLLEGESSQFMNKDKSYSFDFLERKYGLSRLSSYSTEEQNNFLAEFEKVIVVQHPFHQLMQLYQNRFFIGTIKSEYRKHFSSFPNFVDFITSSNMTNLPADHRFQTFTQYCSPCYMNYTSILKTETIYTDAAYLTSCQLNIQPAQDILHSLKEDMMHASHNHDSLWDELTAEQMDKVHKHFSKDVYTFAYSMSHDTNMDVYSDPQLIKCAMKQKT